MFNNLPEDYQRVIQSIDRFNQQDTNTDGGEPYEVVYAKRMTDMLDRFYPQASYNLQIAARAQHIGRWQIPRDRYSNDKIGYHQWRRALIDLHVNHILRILTEHHFAEEDKDYIAGLIAKKDLKSNPESQVLEDVVCLVFFEHYALDFANKHKGRDIQSILEKVLNKMSDNGKAFISSIQNKEVAVLLMDILNKKDL